MEVIKHDAAQWPSDETDTESRKRQERAGRRIVRGKKQLREGQRRNQAVNEEIVPIHHRAGEAGSCCPESRGFRGVPNAPWLTCMKNSEPSLAILSVVCRDENRRRTLLILVLFNLQIPRH
jgi:hypothetical protein